MEKNQNIPFWRPVAHLYRAIGVAVPAHMARLEQIRSGIGLFPEDDVSYTYRADGLRESNANDSNFDGAPEYESRVGYDAMGRMTSYLVQVGDIFEGHYVIRTRRLSSTRAAAFCATKTISDRSRGSALSTHLT